MSIVIRPREYFAIVRQLDDHTDSGTYYVQAVIRNARTDAVIETVNLTDRGDNRFSKEWQAPADTSGQGFYVSIATTVYSDSGYNTKASKYGEEIVTHRIYDDSRNKSAGGMYVDYDKIEKIVKSNKANLGDMVKVTPDNIDNIIKKALKPLEKQVKKLPAPIDHSKQLNSLQGEIELLAKREGVNMDAMQKKVNQLTDFVGSVEKTIASLKKTLASVDKDMNGVDSVIRDLGKNFEMIEQMSLDFKKPLDDIQRKIGDFLIILEKKGLENDKKKMLQDRASRLTKRK